MGALVREMGLDMQSTFSYNGKKRFCMSFLLLLLFLMLISVGVRRRMEGFSLEITVFLRGVMALLVLYHHMGGISDNWGIQTACGRYAVAFFFFLSGYGLMLGYGKMGERYLDGFVHKRLVKILVPYGLAVCVSCAMKWNEYGVAQFWENVLTGESVVSFGYFVEALLALYCCFYAMMRAFGKLYGPWMIVPSTLSLGAMFFLWNWNAHWYISLLGFPTGVLVCRYENCMRRYFALSVSGVVVALLLIVLVRTTCEGLNNVLLCFALLIVPTFCITLYFLTSYLIIRKLSPLSFVGKISYEIYIYQGVVFSLCYTVFGPAHWLFVALLCVVVALFFNRINGKLIGLLS